MLKKTKSWLSISCLCLTLAGCSNNDKYVAPPAPEQPAYNGPVDEIPGVEPIYEKANPSTLQDYQRDGIKYKIVQDPSHFSEMGLATTYGEENQGNTTATGDTFDTNALAAAHPTLPLPSYVRVTNLANGRRIVVRVNDRGPYLPDRIIALTPAAARLLNISNNTKVRVDYIRVAPDNSVSGPGTIGTTVAKQSFALPSRPDIGGQNIQSNPAAAVPTTNNEVQNNQTVAAPSAPAQSTAPATPVAGSTPAATEVNQQTQPSNNAASGDIMLQVGAVKDSNRANEWQQKLSQQFHVPGKTVINGELYRVQLGPFNSRQEATDLQVRLLNEAHQASFIATP